MKLLRALVILITVEFSLTYNVDEHIKMLSDIHNYYKTSSVIFLHYAHYSSTSEAETIFELMLMLSKQKIMSITASFNEIQKIQNYYKNQLEGTIRITRPMVVIFLSSELSIKSFTEYSSYLDFRDSIYIILFVEIDESPVLKVCLRHDENLFHLRLDTRLLIKCYNDTNLQEWYSLEPNRTESYNLSTWNMETGLVLNTNDTIYIRRSDLRRQVFRIGTVKTSSLLRRVDEELTGFLGELMNALQKFANFTVKLEKESKEYGSWNETMKSWSGAVGLLINGQIDLVVADMTMTSRRTRSVDFTTPILLARCFLYVREPSTDGKIRWDAYFRSFKQDIWSAVILLLLITPLLLTFMKIVIQKEYVLSRLLSDNYINIWGIYCQQGAVIEPPKLCSLRLAYFSIFISAFVVLSAYSASLISNLSVPLSSLAFSTLEGFVKDGSYKLIVIKDTAEYDLFRNSNDSVLRRMNKLLLSRNDLPKSVQEGLKMICERKLAFYINEIAKRSTDMDIPCELVRIATGRYDSIGMILPRGSPYTGLINYHLEKFKGYGILNRLKYNYLRNLSQIESRHLNSVSLAGLALLFVIILGGIVLGIGILFLEKLCSYYSNKWEMHNEHKFVYKSQGIR